MKKNTLYIILIVVLLLLNVFQLSKFLFHPKPIKHHEANFKDKAITLLELDKQQANTFFDFSKKHHKQINELQKKQKKLTSLYFEQASDSILDLITNLDKEKIIVTQNHFEEIKSILTPNQYANFEKFKQQAIHVILNNQKKPKP